MPSFEPNKRHLWELLIYFFNLNKSAAKVHRLFVETDGDAALSDRSCREWFEKFKNNAFDIEDKESCGRLRSTKTRNWKHYRINICAKREKNKMMDNTSNKT